MDAQLLQEAMDRLAEIKRKQEDLLLRMSAGTGTLYEGQQQSLRTQFTDAIEQENILERYIAFEQSRANFFDSLSELVYQANKAVQELTDHVTFNSQTGTYGLEKLDTTRFEALQELLPKKKKYNFNEYEIRYNGATHILLKKGIVDVEATNAYNEAIKNGELDKVSNQATESAETIKAVVAALKKGRDPITGQKISKAQSFGIIAGLVYMYAGGRYKGRKIKLPKSAQEKLKKKKAFKNKKASGGLKIPQGLSQKQFDEMSILLKKELGSIGDDIFVQGSRAGGTAKPTSDIDIGIRVSQHQFDNLIKKSFGTPNPGSAKERTMLHAMESGKIQAGEAKLRGLRKELESLLGIEADVSIILKGGSFDNPPYLPIK